MPIRIQVARRVVALTLLAAIGGLGTPRGVAQAQAVGVEYDPFLRNRIRASVGAGISVSDSDTYLRLGVGAGYFVADGLELGLDTDIWLIGDPTVWNLTPGLLYVFHFVPTLKPYLGTFYRHAFVFDAQDLDSIGARAGLYLVSGHVYFGAGAVYERWLDCDGASFVDCDQIYPEVVLAFSF